MLKEWHMRCSRRLFHFLLCYTKLLEVTHICECDSISITINYSNHCLFSLQANKSGQALLDAVFRQLDLVETSYFGLRYLDEDNQPVSDKSSFISYDIIEQVCNQTIIYICKLISVNIKLFVFQILNHRQ